MHISEHYLLTPDTRKPKVLLQLVNLPHTGMSAYLDKIKRQMLDKELEVAIVMSPKESYVLADQFKDASPESITVSKPLETELLLSGKSKRRVLISGFTTLERQFASWLTTLLENWDAAVPIEYTEYFVPEVIGSMPDHAVVSHSQ